MKSERLFRILGLVDDGLVDEAVSASPAASKPRRIGGFWALPRVWF